MGRFLWILLWLVTFLPPMVAQQPAEQPQAVDRTTNLERRMEALERENAATKAENAKLREVTIQAPPTVPGRFSDPTLTPNCPTGGASPGSPGAVESFIERLGTHYDKGFVLVESSDPQRIPFRLVFGN